MYQFECSTMKLACNSKFVRVRRRGFSRRSGCKMETLADTTIQGECLGFIPVLCFFKVLAHMPACIDVDVKGIFVDDHEPLN